MKCASCKAKIPEGKMKCPNCGRWQSLGDAQAEVFRLSEIEDSEENRLRTGPWDLAWGGGFVTDSITFFAGRPGSGKSTILLQIAASLAAQDLKTLYISKEESLRKVRNRANRLGIPDALQARIEVVRNFGGTLRDLLEQVQPRFLIVDSLPSLVGLGWKDTAEAVNALDTIKEYAIETLCPAIIVNHVNGQGEFSGLVAFEHLVDITMHLTKDRKNPNLRTLAPEKSRDGAVDVAVRFNMTPTGLVYLEPTAEDEDAETDFSKSGEEG